MVIFLEDGRLGNQLFQYLGLRKYYPDHLLILIGFNDLQSVVSTQNSIIFKNKIFKNFIFLNIARYLLKLLSDLRLISIDFECDGEVDYSIIKKNGLISELRWLKKAFFQHKSCLDVFCRDNFPKKFIKRTFFLNSAEYMLREILPDHHHSQLVFVHIRRGDYQKWPSEDSPAILPLEWYLAAMIQIRESVNAPHFLIFSDDYGYVREKLGGMSDITILGKSIYEDFLIMSLCGNGILSASSYSWWAGYLAHRKYPDGKFFGPKYWAGHKKGQWYPPHFKAEWINYINVSPL